MSTVKKCDECGREEGKIYAWQPSQDRWFRIHRAVWSMHEATDFDLCSWPCVAAWANHAQEAIDAWEASQRGVKAPKKGTA